MPIEHRTNHRIQLESFSQVHLHGSPDSATALDLSIQGLRVQTNAHLKSGALVHVLLFDDTIQCQAEVCWIKGENAHGAREIGLRLENAEYALFANLLKQLHKPLETLEILLYTPVPLLAESIALYLELTDVKLFTATAPETAIERLLYHPCDLLVLDEHPEHIPRLLDVVLKHPQLQFLPVIVLASKLRQDLLDAHTAHVFLEILTKPVDIQELVLRSVSLMEQAHRYAQLEMHRQEAEKQLASVQRSFETQNQEAMSLLSQVMQQSESMGQLIQLQEALLGIQSFSGVVHFAQSWVMENCNVPVNVWNVEESPMLLGENPLEHPTLSLEQRLTILEKSLQRRTKILQEETVLIRKNDFVLEVLSPEARGDVVDRLTFFMKVLAPVLLSKQQKEALAAAHQQIQEALSLEQTAKARLNQELLAAAEVQNLLIPKRMPKLASLELECYYQSAADMGGDWFQVYEFKGHDQVLIGIGDVTGHGAQAALVTAIATGFFAEVQLEYAEMPNRPLPAPSALLNQLNRILCEVTQGKSLMTFYLGLYTPQTRELTYASAAHPIPLVFRHNESKRTSRFKRLSQPIKYGFRLGNTKNAHYQDQRLKLAPQDLILWFTDGVTECVNEQGQELSLRRLSSRIPGLIQPSLKATMHALIQDLQSYRQNTPLEDDMAFVLAKIL